jgi:hypothetical protein
MNFSLVLEAFIPHVTDICRIVSDGQHILCCVFCIVFSSSCVPYVASFSGRSIFGKPYCFAWIINKSYNCTYKIIFYFTFCRPPFPVFVNLLPVAMEYICLCNTLSLAIKCYHVLAMHGVQC